MADSFGRRRLTTSYILTRMQSTAKFLLSGAFTLALGAGVLGSLTIFAQGGARTTPTAKPVNVVPQTPTFRATTDLVSLDVIVRDSKGQFVADLKPGDFEIY